jgi:hypothetical protein
MKNVSTAHVNIGISTYLWLCMIMDRCLMHINHGSRSQVLLTPKVNLSTGNRNMIDCVSGI